ncbi:MAG: hypothetical protein IKZ25_05250 [Clostridia bacterium]|nr:hypothetical protein [Clostridia bacterium]
MRIISLILCFVMVFGLFTGCAVKPLAPSATGESFSEVSKEETTPEITSEIFEPTKENTPEKDKETTYEWIGPQDNYPIEYLDIDYNNYPQRKGFLKPLEEGSVILFGGAVTLKKLNSLPNNICVKNNHVLAKINKVEKLKIKDRYYLKYQYDIQKVYYGNLKEGDIVDVYMKDWTEKQEIIDMYYPSRVKYDSDFKDCVAFPRVGQYIVTRIHSYQFIEGLKYLDREKYINYYNNILYKNEVKIMEENYFVESNIYHQMLFDENQNLISTGAVMLSQFKKYKNDENATIEKFSDVDEYINYVFVERE